MRLGARGAEGERGVARCCPHFRGPCLTHSPHFFFSLCSPGARSDQLFNYGCFPQTWESPQLWTEDTDGSKTRGDNDPIDVVEIGARQYKAGSIVRVKVLGVLGLIDAGETECVRARAGLRRRDPAAPPPPHAPLRPAPAPPLPPPSLPSRSWKVFAISVDDPIASRINTLEDMKLHMPGALEAERDYLRYYKQDINSFLFDGEVKDEVYAKRMIAETHEAWKKLVLGNVSWEAEAEAGAPAGSPEAPAVPSILAAGLTRSQGSAGALAAMVGAPVNATDRLVGGGGGGKDSSSEAEFGGGAAAPSF